MNAAKRPLLIGNWKLNHTKASANVFFDELLVGMRPEFHSIDLAIAPVATLLDFAHQKLKNTGIDLAAQNVFYEIQGAYTGEWSAENLQELGVKYCLVGHSERRKIFLETDKDAAQKAAACLRAHIKPVACIGETLEEREQGLMHEVIKRQTLAFIEVFKDRAVAPIFAYEPVWAIGTGRVASPALAQEAHLFIRELLSSNLGAKIAKDSRILYGGSVTPQNIKELVGMPDVDGALVGGASLQVPSFLAMIRELS